MDITVLIIMAVAAMILYAVGGRAYRFYLFYRQVSKIPGPEYKIPFFGFAWNFMALKKEDRIGWFTIISNNYKDGLFKLWLGPMASVNIRKPEHVEVILRSNTQITKTTVYEFMEPWLGRGLLTSTGPQWFHSRKLITPAFHFSILEDFAEVMIDKAAILNKCIEREIKIHGDKPIEIFELAVKCALDIICETAMGVNVHAQEEVESEYIKAIHNISSGVNHRFFRPWLRPDWIFYRVSSGKTFQEAVDVSHKLCTRVIQRKQQERKLSYAENNKLEKNGTTGDGFGNFVLVKKRSFPLQEKLSMKNVIGKPKRKAFLDLLLEANEKEDNPMSIEELRDQASTFMFAGHDTTGALVSWTLFSLGNDLDVQRKVHQELDEILGDSDDQATLNQLPNLKYLERVIKEGLRLYPSAPNISRYLTDEMQIGDYRVPKGASVNIQIYHLHRDASLWPDPLRFDPDRFHPDNAKGRHPYAYIPFSAGPRNCIGQKYAILEAKVILAQVLRKFEVKSVESHSTIKKYSEIILRPLNGIYVHMTKRS